MKNFLFACSCCPCAAAGGLFGRTRKDAGAAGGGAASVTFTHYSDLTEVFAEHRPLVVGKDRRFDAHLSWVDDYRAVTSGTLTVELVHADGSDRQGQRQGLPKHRASSACW